MNRRAGYTLTEVCIALGMMLLMGGVVGLFATSFYTVGDARRSGDVLRSVEKAQQAYFADNPGASLASLTTTALNPYMPNSPGSNFNTLLPPRVQSNGVTIDITSSPPVLKRSGATYDPSGSSTDGQWDAGR